MSGGPSDLRAAGEGPPGETTGATRGRGKGVRDGPGIEPWQFLHRLVPLHRHSKEHFVVPFGMGTSFALKRSGLAEPWARLQGQVGPYASQVIGTAIADPVLVRSDAPPHIRKGGVPLHPLNSHPVRMRP